MIKSKLQTIQQDVYMKLNKQVEKDWFRRSKCFQTATNNKEQNACMPSAAMTRKMNHKLTIRESLYVVRVHHLSQKSCNHNGETISRKCVVCSKTLKQMLPKTSSNSRKDKFTTFLTLQRLVTKCIVGRKHQKQKLPETSSNSQMGKYSTFFTLACYYII